MGMLASPALWFRLEIPKSKFDLVLVLSMCAVQIGVQGWGSRENYGDRSWTQMQLLKGQGNGGNKTLALLNQSWMQKLKVVQRQSSNKNCKTKYKQKDKVQIKGKAWAKPKQTMRELETGRNMSRRGQRHEEMQTETYDDQTKTRGKAET